MTLQVPYMSDGSIEREAGSLLAEFAHARGVQIQPPIPIDDIVEKHLKLHVEFDDLHRRLGVPRGGFGNEPDIFGAIWLEAGEIVLDESLDPDVRPLFGEFWKTSAICASAKARGPRSLGFAALYPTFKGTITGRSRSLWISA